MSTARNKGAKGGDSKDWTEKQVFTTGEAAEVCNVSQQTIIRCFDNGRLHGFRVPGSRFRRIPRAELIRFMKANEIPTDVLERDSVKRVLVVDDDPQIVELLVEVLGKDGRFEIETAGNGYDAGLLTESFRPHLILLDFMLPDLNGNRVCERIRGIPELCDTVVIVISGVIDEQEVESLKAAGANDFVKKPFQIDDLMGRIEGLLRIA